MVAFLWWVSHPTQPAHRNNHTHSGLSQFYLGLLQKRWFVKSLCAHNFSCLGEFQYLLLGAYFAARTVVLNILEFMRA